MPRKVLVVGAGPSGTQAAHQLLAHGIDVDMIDFGVAPADASRQSSAESTFLGIRTRDARQSSLWWGEEYSQFPFEQRKGGAGLTPGRSFVTDATDDWTPVATDRFAPVESLAKGGLGEAWGLGAFELSDAELEAVGLAQNTRDSYRRVRARIGVSAPDQVDALPVLELDEAADRLWHRYRRHADTLGRLGLRVEKTPLALLSQDFDGRAATPYSDLDFYLNQGFSAYRPAFDIERLRARRNFVYSGGWLATTVRETSERVEIEAISRADRTRRVFAADAAILCAGTLGTARLVLRSGLTRLARLGLACSPYLRIIAVQPSMVGRALRDRRHSMGQLVMTLERPDRAEWVPLASLLSYRSLLVTRLMREAPLPVRQARAFFQLIQSGLVVAGIFFPQTIADARVSVRLERDESSPTGDRLTFEQQAQSERERSAISEALHAFARGLRSIGAVPIRTVHLPHGSSIHYGGTLPFGEETDRNTGCLVQCKRVFVGDGSPFRMVPGKGITLTLMAYADWVANRIVDV